jgi:hypothetical protein
LPDVEVFHFTSRSNVQAPYITVWQGYRGTVYHFLKHKGIVQALLVSVLLITSAAARIVIAALLGITTKRYRSVARIYASVFWSLLVRNPIRANTWRLGTSLHESQVYPAPKRDGQRLW